jgi:HEAT repeat protein
MSPFSSLFASVRSPRLKFFLLVCLAPLQISGAQVIATQMGQSPSENLSQQIERSTDATTREVGQDFLKLTAVNLDELIQILSDPQVSTAKRIQAIGMVQDMSTNGEMAAPALTKLLSDDQPELRKAALQALVQVGARATAVPELITLLKDGDEPVRALAAQALGSLGREAQAAIEPLSLLVGDPSPTVRLRAVETLGAIGPAADRVVPSLLPLLNDPDAKVKKATISTLGLVGPAAKSAVNTLAQLLQRGDREQKIIVMTTLGQLGHVAQPAIPELVLLLHENDSQMRSFAVLTLGKIGGEKAVLPLEEALQDVKDVRLSATIALGQVGPAAREALPELVAKLQDVDPDVQKRTAITIGQVAESLLDQPKQLRRQDLNQTIAELEKALPILEEPQRGFSGMVQQRVKRSLIALKNEQQSRPLDRLTDWGQSNWIAALILLYLATAPTVSLLTLWFRPLWILRVNNLLQPYTDFELPLPGGNSIKIPLRFVLFFGWLHYNPRVLDAWVNQQIGVARYAFAQKNTVTDRQVHIPIPVVFQGQTVAQLSNQHLQSLFSDGRQCLLVWGEGGSGKTSLACQLAKWAMSERKNQRLAKHLMLPVLIEQELDFKIAEGKDPFREAIRGQLQALIDSADPIEDKFLERLLRLRRILVIVDHLSELSDASRAAVRPGNPDFPANALVVTSRREEALDRVPKSVIKPLRIEGNRLSSFLEAYLIRCNKRELFTDAEYFDACSQLSKMVGQRNVTVLLAKLYAEQMITLKSGAADGFLPDNIPDLMLSYLNELNRDRNHHEPDNRRLHQITKIIAWECLQQNYRPNPTPRETLLTALQQQLRVDQATAIGWLQHLENRLRIIHTVGPAQDQVCFALDPLAECLAALHWVEHYGADVSAWHQWLLRADTMPGAPHSIQGMLLAMRDCCLQQGRAIDLPEFVFDELGRRVGLSQELLRKAQVEQRIVRLSPKILTGETKTRLRAMRELMELGTAARPVLPSLLRALEDKDWKVRQSALKVVGAIGTEARSAIPTLVERFTDRDRRVACEAIACLGKIGSASIPALISALESQIAYVRGTAAWVLAGFESHARAAVPELMQALADEDWQVRWVAAHALGCIGADAKPAVYALVEACKGEYVLVAKEASRALWRISGEEADAIVNALGDRLDDRKLRHSGPISVNSR